MLLFYFMARGRNHNRNRNHSLQNSSNSTQQQTNQQQLQQQQQTKTKQPPPAPVASIITDNHCSPSTNSEEEEKRNDAICNDPSSNNNYAVKNTAYEIKAIAHLESSSNTGPASCSTTNTYQMTTSNNSLKNFNQVKVNNNNENDDDDSDHNDNYDCNNNDGDDVESEVFKHQSNSAGENCYYSSASPKRDANCDHIDERVNELRGGNIAKNKETTNIIRSSCTEQNGSVHAQVIGKENKGTNDCPQFINNYNYANEALVGSPGLNQYDPNSVITDVRNFNNNNNNNNNENHVHMVAMGQKTTKCESNNISNLPSLRSNRESFNSISEGSSTGSKRERETSSSSSSASALSLNDTQVPLITVSDCSNNDAFSSSSHEEVQCVDRNLNEKEEFFDFETENRQEIFVDTQNGEILNYEQQKANTYHYSPPTSFPYNQMRCNQNKLEDVPEQEENEDEDDQNDEEKDDVDSSKEEEEEEEDDEEFVDVDRSDCLKTVLAKHSCSCTPDEPLPLLKSNTNESDLNSSNSFLDSGMGDSLATSANCHYSPNSGPHQQKHDCFQQQRLPFVRDNNSTDCDETLTQCDDLQDFIDAPHDYHDSAERLVCIESISLPDVVVESTNSSGSSSSSSSSAAQSNLNSSSTSSTDTECDIININGAESNNCGNVHFIPIHLEGQRNKLKTNDTINGSTQNDSIEITEIPLRKSKHISENDLEAEKLKQELQEQKSQFHIQLEDAHKNVQSLEGKINEMQLKIENLEQDLSAKTWNVDRLQGELNAAQRDDEYVRKKLKLLEDEKNNLRHRYDEWEDEFKKKYDELETQYQELQDQYKETQNLASSLHSQLMVAQNEVEKWRKEIETIRVDLEEQIRILKNALENSENERKICEDRWQKQFEMLRTHNMDREESIMTDCEWQLRQMQKQCKDKTDSAERERKAAVEKVERLENELEERCKEVDDLRHFQAQVNSLRGVLTEQEHSIRSLVEQIENLKSDLTAANDNLQEQIENVEKIKIKCERTLYDKERQMLCRIDEVRNEAAAFWEDKLYTEMTRLKNELESVYVDERRDALDKLQTEHIEELRAITNRYTANEDELRAELTEVQERLELKTDDFLELREKSDNALLQIRMHLERADRDYQVAMCREEEKRDALENDLHKQFETEKQEMEERFEKRFDEMKDEFAKKMNIASHELTSKHQKEIGKLKQQLLSEKEEALQELIEKHRKKLKDCEDNVKELELQHKRDLKDLRSAYDAEKAVLDKRDINNANEIEQLHRKCRCLTNLFEEMRMRYERRDPRPEDLREISELRSRCEAQERDLYLLTDRLREMQIQMNELQRNGNECNVLNGKNSKKSKQIKKPPPKTIPTSCDIIYEENEERDSPPPPVTLTQNAYSVNNSNNNGNQKDHSSKNEKIADVIPAGHNNYKVNGKLINNVNEDDSHMITAM
uniref:Uncharacterized protein n=1 Tax=Glossina pallidipes TaxID=7398 RepID=A0A1A9ZC76_GLOPL